MVLFFYFPTNIPQVYHTCFTKDCLTLTIWSQYKGSGTWSARYHSCRSAARSEKPFSYLPRSPRRLRLASWYCCSALDSTLPMFTNTVNQTAACDEGHNVTSSSNPCILAHYDCHPEMRTTTLCSFTRQTSPGITLSFPGSFISKGEGKAVSMTLSHRFSCREGISKSCAICSILSITCKSSSCDRPQMVKASIRPLGSCQSGVNSWRPCQSISLTPCAFGPSVKKRSRRTFG
jgi:hypothetical protein